ncbi:MAG: DUF3299 domain-containing protein [Rubripirellula sp.]
MKLASGKSFLLAKSFLAISLAAGNTYANDALATGSAAPGASATDSDATSRTIQWSHLAPENGRPFIDPFTKLSSDQLADLSYVRRIRWLIADEKIDADGDDAKQATRLVEKLATQGIDANWLLVQSQRIPQMRRQQIEAVAESVAKSIDSTTVEIVGFALSIPSQSQKVAGFLVMPTAAMCGHSTAPSPLHVAFVETDQQYSLQSQGTPVRIRGEFIAESKTTAMISGSGATVFESAYKIIPSRIDVLSGVRGDSLIKTLPPQDEPIETTKE